MVCFFAVWLALILVGLFFCILGGVGSLSGALAVLFLLATGFIALTVAVVRQILKQMGEQEHQLHEQARQVQKLEQQLQSQSRRMEKLEAQLEQWKKENSDQETRRKRRVSPCGASFLGRSRAARCAAPTEWSGAARPGGRALHGMESRGQVGLTAAPAANLETVPSFS